MTNHVNRRRVLHRFSEGLAPASWREDMHPRDGSGKFTSGGGGGDEADKGDKPKMAAKVKAAYGKLVESMTKDGVPPRIAKAAAAIGSATLVPGLSIANISGAVLSAVGLPVIGAPMMALPTGFVEVFAVVGGTKAAARACRKVKELLKKRRELMEVTDG